MDFLLLAQGVAEIVTSTVVAGLDPAQIFGLTVVEWGILLGALTTFLEALRQRQGKLKNGKKLQALQEAMSETLEKSPDLRRSARILVKSKATKMNVSLDVIHALLESKDDLVTPDPDAPSPEKLKDK